MARQRPTPVTGPSTIGGKQPETAQGELFPYVCELEQGYNLLLALLRDRPRSCRDINRSVNSAHVKRIIGPLWFVACAEPCPYCGVSEWRAEPRADS